MYFMWLFDCDVYNHECPTSFLWKPPTLSPGWNQFNDLQNVGSRKFVVVFCLFVGFFLILFFFGGGGEGYTFSILYVLFLVPSFVTSNDAILRTLSLYDNRVAMNRYADCFDPVKSKNNGMMIWASIMLIKLYYAHTIALTV